jgi:hypothetical protein
MSLNLSANRSSNKPAIQFKKLLGRIYLGFDESQIQRSAAIIDRYRHLIPNYDEKNRKKIEFLTRVTSGLTSQASVLGRKRTKASGPHRPKIRPASTKNQWLLQDFRRATD